MLVSFPLTHKWLSRDWMRPILVWNLATRDGCWIPTNINLSRKTPYSIAGCAVRCKVPFLRNEPSSNRLTNTRTVMPNRILDYKSIIFFSLFFFNFIVDRMHNNIQQSNTNWFSAKFQFEYIYFDFFFSLCVRIVCGVTRWRDKWQNPVWYSYFDIICDWTNSRRCWFTWAADELCISVLLLLVVKWLRIKAIVVKWSQRILKRPNKAIEKMIPNNWRNFIHVLCVFHS